MRSAREALQAASPPISGRRPYGATSAGQTLIENAIFLKNSLCVRVRARARALSERALSSELDAHLRTFVRLAARGCGQSHPRAARWRLPCNAPAPAGALIAPRPVGFVRPVALRRVGLRLVAPSGLSDSALSHGRPACWFPIRRTPPCCTFVRCVAFRSVARFEISRASNTPHSDPSHPATRCLATPRTSPRCIATRRTRATRCRAAGRTLQPVGVRTPTRCRPKSSASGIRTGVPLLYSLAP